MRIYQALVHLLQSLITINIWFFLWRFGTLIASRSFCKCLFIYLFSSDVFLLSLFSGWYLCYLRSFPLHLLLSSLQLLVCAFASSLHFLLYFLLCLTFSRPLGMCPSPLQVPSRAFKCPMVPLAPSSTFSTLEIVPFAPSNALWCPSTLQHTDPKAGWIGIRIYSNFFSSKFSSSLIIRLVIST